MAMEVTPLVPVVPLHDQPAPPGGVIETTVVFVGIGCQRTAPLDVVCVATLVNAWMYVMFWPAYAGVGDALLVAARSGLQLFVMVTTFEVIGHEPPVRTTSNL